MMQRNPVFESLKDSSRLRTLVWHLSMQKASYTCPFEGCGELIRQNRQDTPPRSFRELAEALITSHFMGQCHWCKELAPQGTRSGTSRVGRINVVDPDSGATMPFFVYVQDNEWRCTMWSPVDADSKAVSLQQNPLFAPHSHGLVHALGGTELVLSFLHPCVKEALEAKDAATRELLDTTCRLNAAATVLMHATNMHLPAAIGNAHTCTELAVLASQDALKHWCAANATVMQRLLHHPPLSGAEFQLFKDFVEFMS